MKSSWPAADKALAIFACAGTGKAGVPSQIFLQAAEAGAFFPTSGLVRGEWLGWFCVRGSGTGVHAARNLLCYNFSRPICSQAGESPSQAHAQGVLLIMPSSKSKIRVLGAFAMLVTLALAISCRGFFVNQPTSVTITPSAPTFTAGQQQSLVAQAAFSNNSSKNVTASATWNSSNSCIVAIITSGSDAGNATDVGTGGSATITASYNGVIGTATASVPSGLTITPCPELDVAGFPEVVFNVGTSATFAATGATSWSSLNPSVVSFASPSSGAATFPTKGQTSIQVTDGTNQGSLLITVQ